jgi:hypothetical protein
MSMRRATLLALVAVALVGCGGGADDLSDKEAEQLVQGRLEQLAEDEGVHSELIRALPRDFTEREVRDSLGVEPMSVEDYPANKIMDEPAERCLEYRASDFIGSWSLCWERGKSRMTRERSEWE